MIESELIEGGTYQKQIPEQTREHSQLSARSLQWN